MLGPRPAGRQVHGARRCPAIDRSDARARLLRLVTHCRPPCAV